MLKFIVLFFAAFAVFSPLFLIGIRKYTGQKARRALGAISENDKAFGKALIFVGLAEGVALYGLIVALLLLFV